MPAHSHPRKIALLLAGLALAAASAHADSWFTGTSGQITTNTSSAKVGVGITSTAAGSVKNRLDVEGAAAIGANFSGSATAPSNGLVVEGNVGIGTASIASGVKLDVNGTIKANKIQIKTWSMEVPDYVFRPDYDLKSLQDTEAFIGLHRHLPDVPSARALEREGMDLAAMNLILLRKVEELTLHAIRQEKRLDGMRTALEARHAP